MIHSICDEASSSSPLASSPSCSPSCRSSRSSCCRCHSTCPSPTPSPPSPAASATGPSACVRRATPATFRLLRDRRRPKGGGVHRLSRGKREAAIAEGMCSLVRGSRDRTEGNAGAGHQRPRAFRPFHAELVPPLSLAIPHGRPPDWRSWHLHRPPVAAPDGV